MKAISKTLAGIALSCCVTTNVAHASIIQSMTIGEIGIASGGLGNSALYNVGGEFYIEGFLMEAGFDSAGSSAGAIIMNQIQGINAFTPGFAFFDIPALPHTLNGAPSGSISDDILSLNLSGWGAQWNGTDFAFAPDAGTLLTSIAQLDANHYFFTADWSHVITTDESAAFAGITTGWHIEGIATTIPEPGTGWLVGIALLGWVGVRRRKPVY
ncbi:MAG: PEP-CTERM sorting domain-containing protein [Thiobacillus sp.]|nr:PEP-CTERM sorting domain-containing protein [Thiobacillus sp.]